MKKTRIALLSFLLFVFSLSSCGNGEEQQNSSIQIEKSFSIKGSSTNYYINQKDDFILSIDQAVGLDENAQINYIVVGTNTVQGVIEQTDNEAVFSASSIGQITIKGVLGELLSTNELTIYCRNSDETVSQKLQDVFDSETGAVFGQTYDIGIGKEDSSSYKFTNTDGILEINEEGLLEVCGFGYGKGQLKRDNEIVFDNYYNIYNSILCTKIKEDLIEKKIIENKSDCVTNSMLTNITSLSMSGELINDKTSSYGIKYLTSLKKLDLSHNNISDLSFLSSITSLVEMDVSYNEINNVDYIVENQKMEKLNLAHNLVSDVKKLQYMHAIEYLDLSFNGITNINPLSSVYSLNSLFLNGNALKSFYDPLSGLEKLTELGVGFCGIKFTDIKSLPYLQNLTYLDASETGPSLSNMTELTKLKTLLLSNCELNKEDVSKLNVLTNLETLDISENDFDLKSYGDGLDGTKLTKLSSLSIGGSAFTEIPDFSNFKKLNNLDLTNSYNITSISSLASLKITSLVLDDCNSLNTNNFGEEIKNITTLSKLSIVSGFNYLSATSYDWLVSKVKAGEMNLRLYGDEYCDSNTIVNYTKAVFFSLSDFISHCDYDQESEKYVAPYTSDNKEIVLVLANDSTSNFTKFYNIEIPPEIYEFDLIGNKNQNYSIEFSVQDRNESSITFNFNNFSDSITGKEAPVIKSPVDSKTTINYYGVNSFTSDYQSGTVVTYDISITPKYNNTPGSLSIKSTYLAKQGSEAKYGTNGEKGAPAIYCHDGSFSGSLSVVGGNGGQGGHGKGVFVFGGDCSGYGGDGGQGGAAISYGGIISVDGSVVLQGGDGGQGGTAESWALSAVFPGDKGATGEKTEKH